MRNRGRRWRGGHSTRSALSRGRPERFRSGGLAAWWDASVGITKDGSNLVSQWNDRSGNARNLLQASGTLQPLWVASGLYNRPTVRFDGSDNYMQTGVFTLNQPVTIVDDHNIITLTASSGHDITWDGIGGTSFLLQCSDPTTLLLAGAALQDGLLPTAGAFKRSVVVLNGATSFYRYGAALRMAGDAGTNAMGGFTMAARTDGTRSTNAEWPECIIYNYVLNASQINRLESYMKAKGAV